MRDKSNLHVETIPEQLKAFPNFVLWKLEDRDGKKTKVPYQTNGSHAKSNAPDTWGSFSNVVETYLNNGSYNGIGFCLGDGTPIGIDLDHCRCPAFDLIMPWAQTIIDEFDSYTEVSPSGKGIRIFVNGGSLPEHGRKNGPIEIYESGRYLTVTGNHIPGTPPEIRDRSEAILTFHKRHFGNKQEDSYLEKIVQSATMPDVTERLQRAFSSGNGDKIRRIYDGDISEYPSQSEADLALCSHLAFWLNRNPLMIDQAFRASGLMRPKWDERHFADGQTYGQSVVAKAIESCNQGYNEGGFPTAGEIDFNSAIKRLAELSPLQYDCVRRAEARALGVRPATLDAAVKAARKENETDELPFDETEPWPDSVDPATLLREIVAVIQRFIVCSEEVAIATALWIVMTWLIDVIEVLPLAIISAPEKRCGKTLLLNLMAKLSAKPVTASSISPAALYRTIELWHPTLFIDEADACIKDNEELRGVLNSGHTKGSARVLRCVGDNLVPTYFSTWGAKAISGIGYVADTLMDRGIVLELHRRLPHEKVDRIRNAEHSLFDTLRSKIVRFADDYGEEIRNARPPLPRNLNDRAQDNWEPLLAIAMVAGNDWLQSAIAAALKLSGGESDSQTIGVELLSDIQKVFEARGEEKIFTEDLIKALCADDERPWTTYNRGGKGITPRQLAAKVKKYGVLSKSIRIGSSTAKGYMLEQFHDAFMRYVVPPPENIRHTSQPAATKDSGDFASVTPSFSVTDEIQPKCLNILSCDVVTDEITPSCEEKFLLEKLPPKTNFNQDNLREVVI